MVKKEERNLCFTHDEDEEKDDDVSVYCVQAQGSLVCWVAACAGRDTATLCSTYTLYVLCILYLWHMDTVTQSSTLVPGTGRHSCEQHDVLNAFPSLHHYGK